jgi:hypothetical protein
MTTPPTPADWYPDPENPAGLRYWDGTAWTEHRAPANPPVETPAAQTYSEPTGEFRPSEQATSVAPLPDQPTTDEPATGSTDAPWHGAHRAPDETQQEPSQPYDTHPRATYEPPAPDLPAEWDAPMPSWDSPSPETKSEPETFTPSHSPSDEAPSYEAASSAPPSYQPSSSAPPPYEPSSYEQSSYAPSSYEAAAFAPPPGSPPGSFGSPTGPSGEGPNKKLVAGILGGALAILIVIVVVITVVLVRRSEPTVTSQGTSPSASPTTSTDTSTESSSESPSPESPTPTPPPTGGEATDGDYTFSVAGTETGDTITSTVSDEVQTTADGMFYVVYVNVTNNGTAPATFVATFQQLSAAGTTFPLDDEATAFLNGTIANVAPGDKVETPLVYDIPAGTQPDSILLRADPSTPGASLPLQ